MCNLRAKLLKLTLWKIINKKNQDLNLGSNLYEGIAIIFATTLVIFGVILILADFGFGLGITTMVTGAFIYVSISWFGRVLNGLEQNNAYLQKY